jgi:hypothetical protein
LIRKIKNIIWKILNKINIGGPIQLMLNGALVEDGWYKSFNTKQSVDKFGKPIPWCTYPFIKFIEPRLKKDFHVFEFGGGNSTIWYAERVKNIKAVEHDKSWVEYIKKKMPSNAEIIYKQMTADGDYSKEVMKDGNKYNIIIIDGRDRNNCAKNSINGLTNDGIIVFDNSNLSIYKEAINLFFKEGFKRIDFIGMSPVTNHNNYTSIFYKDKNCLGI